MLLSILKREIAICAFKLFFKEVQNKIVKVDVIKLQLK